MDSEYLKTWTVTLNKRGIALEPGLSDAEVSQTEGTYGFRFPPDLRALLQHTLPVDKNFPNWRGGVEADLGFRKNKSGIYVYAEAQQMQTHMAASAALGPFYTFVS